MASILEEATDCHRCGYELERGDDTCPNCGFRPKETGIQVALSFLLAVVVLITAMMIIPSPLLVLLAAVSFLLTIGAFVLAFVARPYRLGSLFVRFSS